MSSNRKQIERGKETATDNKAKSEAQGATPRDGGTREAHGVPRDVLMRSLGTDPARGLGGDEAAARLLRDGENRLAQKKKRSTLSRFFEQFKDVMIIILIVAAIVSFVVACVEGGPREFFEPVLILLIVVLNAVMGVVQENKAERALDALKNMSAPHARVIRDGEERIIAASGLVVGDIILLEAGDFVPADARLISSTGLKCEESALTGESVPAEKHAADTVDEAAALGDRSNMVFSGTAVTYGTARAVVTAIGMSTEMGRIAGLLSGETDGATPLQRKLTRLGKYLGLVALAACAVIFAVGIIDGMDVLDIFMTAVSLAVSAIPEGLPAIVTVVLSIGVQRMVKRNAIIRRLPAVETLGSASVICSDKTGTLTMNRMTLVKAFVDGAEVEEITDTCSPEVRRLLTYATLCCDGSVSFADGKETHIGDPTETAIVLAAHRNGLEKEKLNEAHPRVAGLPFDSDRKLMSTVNLIDGKYVVTVKGAVDMMESRCVSGDLARAKRINEEMSASALRVLAVAYKTLDELPGSISSETLETGLTLLGLVGMIDPPRPEAREAVAVCREAGIKPIMITGDHVVTATAIAKELGIYLDGDESVTGVELDAMSEEELDGVLERISVYARVSPENKIRIVRAWQRKGQVVSMTGDGVNDAPALKAADIGCAMGITGTDVAKGAADMTLTDDNFSTIVHAVREGRGIYANIRKVIGFLLGTNIGEIITVFLAMLLWRVTPLLSMQLLLINLVTDSLPAIALGMEAVDKDIMKKKPKPKDEGLFAGGLGVRVALWGAMFAVLTLVGFVIGSGYGIAEVFSGALSGDVEALSGAQTLAFMVLALSQIVQAYNMRSDGSLFRVGVFSNRTLNLAALGSLLVVAAVMLTPVRIAFELAVLPPWMYLVGLALSFVPLAVMEITKAAGRFLERRRGK